MLKTIGLEWRTLVEAPEWLLLSATGETNKAGKYLDLAEKASLLLEERVLATEAKKPTNSGN